MANADDEFMQLARERFAQAQDADKHQRDREIEDLRFLVDQWPADIRTSRAGQVAKEGLPPIPPRPCLQIDKVTAPIQQVLNEERQAELGVELVPADDFGDLRIPIDETELELREGLIRLIQRAPEAAAARTWAFDRKVKAGRGYWGVMTRFLPGKTWDQEVYVHRFYNQFSVSLDPAHEQPDGSDADWAFVGTDMAWQDYLDEFPKIASGGAARRNPLIGISDEDFRAKGEEFKGWFTSEGKTRSCRVVDYWYTEHTPRSLSQLADGSSVWTDEVPEGAEVIDTREVIEKTVKWAKLDGTQKLSETDWPGPDIPVIKDLGEEVQPYDKERRVEGMVRGARGAQEGFNAMISKWVEMIAYSPIPPWQTTPQEIEGFEEWYKLAPSRALPYLLSNDFDDTGQRLGRPTRTPLDLPIGPIAASVQMFDEAVKSTTGKGDPELGHINPSLKSGRVVDLLKKQSQFGTSHFLKNHERAIVREGTIINRLLYAIYKPGRLMRLMSKSGEFSEPFRLAPPPAPNSPPGVLGPLQAPQGPPQPLQPNAVAFGPPGVGSAPPGPLPGGAPAAPAAPKVYRLTKDGDRNIVVKVTQSYNSRREQLVAFLGDLFASNPQTFGVFGDLLFKYLDTPGHEEFFERAKLMLDPKIQDLLAQKAQGSDVSPQAMAQIAALQKQLQAAEGVIQKAQQELEAKQTEWTNRDKIAAENREFKGTIELELAHIRAETAIAVAEIQKRADVFVAERDRIGVPASQLSAQAHEVAMGAADAGQAAGMAQQDHANALVAASHAAALQPPPPDQGGAPPEEQQ